MNTWKGRIIGGLIGLLFGNLLGALIGFALGYYLHDKPKNIGYASAESAQNSFRNARYNQELIRSTFALMGFVARGAGRINEAQISKAEQVMQLMQLDSDSRAVAKNAFNYGKSSDFALDKEIESVRKLCGQNTSMVSYLLEIQVQIALADGVLENLEHQRLLQIAVKLGVRLESMERLIQMRLAEMEFTRSFYSSGSGQRSGSYQHQGSYDYQDHSSEQNSGYEHNDSSKLEEAYKVLGLDSSASFEEVKKTHKRLMFKYHPDHLASQGLTPEMMRLYTDKAKDIQAAFDLIKSRVDR